QHRNKGWCVLSASLQTQFSATADLPSCLRQLSLLQLHHQPTITCLSGPHLPFTIAASLNTGDFTTRSTNPAQIQLMKTIMNDERLLPELYSLRMTRVVSTHEQLLPSCLGIRVRHKN
ncbi:unnamed protein product, partial [Ectocarpus sp. 12 AP-2014]